MFSPSDHKVNSRNVQVTKWNPIVSLHACDRLVQLLVRWRLTLALVPLLHRQTGLIQKKKKRRGYVFVPARLKSARQSTTNELIVEGTNNIDNKVARCTLGHYWADRKQQAGGSEARGRGQELTDWLLHCVWKWSYYSSFITMFSAISHYQTTNCLISRIYQYPNHIFFFFTF